MKEFDRLVHGERDRQLALFGDQSGNSELLWLAILAEEVGEVVKATIEIPRGECTVEALRTELVQVAAVCATWLDLLYDDDTVDALIQADREERMVPDRQLLAVSDMLKILGSINSQIRASYIGNPDGFLVMMIRFVKTWYIWAPQFIEAALSEKEF